MASAFNAAGAAAAAQKKVDAAAKKKEVPADLEVQKAQLMALLQVRRSPFGDAPQQEVFPKAKAIRRHATDRGCRTL